MSDNLLPRDDVARARYATLTAALGEPASGVHRAVLARLAAWTDDRDVDALAVMIRERVDRQTSRYRDLIGDVPHLVEATGAPAGEGKVYAVLPTALTALIREAARDQTLRE